MTAITPAYAHAYQATCLAQHFPAVPHQNFRLPKPKVRYPYLPHDLSITRERGNDYHGWAIYTDGGTRVVDGETLAGWVVISRSPHGCNDVMFAPVVTIEVHLAFSGARTHSNSTAEMTAAIEAFSFLGLCGPVTRDEQSCIDYASMHAACICLGTIQARTHVQLALVCQSVICAQHRLRLTMQHVYGHTVIWVMNVPIMLLHLVHLALSPATTLPPARFVITLTHLPVVMAVTASARSWNDCSTLELVQRRFLRIGVSTVFTIGFFVSLTCCLFYFYDVIFDPALSILFEHVYFVLQNK